MNDARLDAKAHPWPDDCKCPDGQMFDWRWREAEINLFEKVAGGHCMGQDH